MEEKTKKKESTEKTKKKENKERFEEIKKNKSQEEKENKPEDKKQKEDNQATSREFISLMKELDKVSKELGFTMQIKFEKEGKHLISEKVTEMFDSVKQQAKNLGQKIEQVEETYKLNKDTKDNILQQHKSNLTEIENQYERVHQAILRQKAINQNREQATMLKEYEWKQTRKKVKKSPQYAEQMKQEKALAKEIKKALDKGDLDTVAIKNEELKHLKSKNPLMLCDKEIEKAQKQRIYIQQLLNQCEQELKNAKIERKSSIQQAAQDKDNQLATVKKQGLFKRIAGAIKNKISGARRFRDNVIGKLAEKIGYVKQETIPQVERVTSEKVVNIEGYMDNARTKILGKNPETREELMQRAEEGLKEGDQEIGAEQQSSIETGEDFEVAG